MNCLKQIGRAIDQFIFRSDRFLMSLVKRFMQALRHVATQNAAVKLVRWLLAELKAMGKDLDDLVMVIDQEIMATITELCQFAQAVRTAA